MWGKGVLSASSAMVAGFILAARTAASEYQQAVADWESHLGLIGKILYRRGLIEPDVEMVLSTHSIVVGIEAAVVVFLLVYAACSLANRTVSGRIS